MLEVMELLNPSQDSLTYFNRSKPVTIQTDANEYRLGNTFASETLTNVETWYANANENVFKFALPLKSFTYTSMKGTSQCRMTISP